MMSPLEKLAEPAGVSGAMDQMGKTKGGATAQADDIMKDFDLELIDNCSYMQTFKIYQSTTFDEIKMAACEFWGFQNFSEMWILTDEYFNNLSTYKDSVQNFFGEQQGYETMNRDKEACVFLLRKDQQRQGLHYLQYESVQLQDDNNKKDNAEAALPEQDHSVQIDKIAKTIVGLTTYEVKIDDKKMQDYVQWTESHNNPSVNIWAFICGLILLILNLVGKSFKNAYEEEYAVRKIVESFYNMQVS